MRIRRNHRLGTIAVTTLCVLGLSSLRAQDTTATQADASAANGSKASAPYTLEPGDQFVYSTAGELTMKGGGQAKTENVDLTTSITVLDKSSDNLTLYAAIAVSEETTAGKTVTAGPRFTFQMPLTGAAPGQEFEKAGLAANAMPTFSVENLFPAIPTEGKSTITLTLPINGAETEAAAETTKDGENLKTVAVASQETTPILTRTSIFSPAKSATESIDTQVNMSLMAQQGMAVEIAVSDKTKLESKTRIPADVVGKLKAEIESAIPVAAKLRTLQMSEPGVMKAVLDDMNKYLAAHPDGEFASLFNLMQKDLTSAVARSANWEKVKAGEVPVEFTAKTIDGKDIKLSDYKGKVVLLDFWATWCGPCMMELPNVKKIYNEYKDKGFQIIGISADETVDDLQKIVQQEDLQWPQIFDATSAESVQEKYGVMKFPTTVLIGKDGKIAEVDVRGEQLGEAVKKLVETK